MPSSCARSQSAGRGRRRVQASRSRRPAGDLDDAPVIVRPRAGLVPVEAGEIEHLPGDAFWLGNEDFVVDLEPRRGWQDAAPIGGKARRGSEMGCRMPLVRREWHRRREVGEIVGQAGSYPVALAVEDAAAREQRVEQADPKIAGHLAGNALGGRADPAVLPPPPGQTAISLGARRICRDRCPEIVLGIVMPAFLDLGLCGVPTAAPGIWLGPRVRMEQPDAEPLPQEQISLRPGSPGLSGRRINLKRR